MSAIVMLQVPRRAQSLVIGRSRKVIADIMAKTGTTISIPPRKEQSSVVTISGDEFAIQDAQQMIEHVLGYELDENELTVAYFAVPKRQHSAIIGTNGTLLKDLRKKCGCHIHVPRVRDRDRNVEVHGTPVAIEIAKKEIEAIVGHSVPVSLNRPFLESKNPSIEEKSRPGQISSSSPRSNASEGPRSSVVINPSTGKPRLDKGRTNEVVFLPSSDDPDPMERILQFISNASVSVDMYVVALDNQNLVVLLQNLLSQNIPVRIIVKNGFPGSHLNEVRTLQGLGAQVTFDQSSSPFAINFVIVDNVLVISGTHSWTKSGSLSVRQIISITNHRDFVRSFVNEFNKSFAPTTFP